MSSINLPAELTASLDTYAAAQGIDRDEAAAHLITQALAIGNAGAVAESLQRRAIEDVFPEAETAEDLWEYVAGDGDGGEGGEFEGRGEHWTHCYKLIRGVWLYHRDTGDIDSQVYQVCGSEEEARQVYRDAIVAACEGWTEADGPVWMECGWEGDIVDQLGQAGLIPSGTYTD
ncbi:hypothetical protein [Glycomyces paridis]|uniref:Uncharacterized protein n=1 Tax=Glycomyces paridis TaxID=2126555 RepID=A0A4S8PCQ0_9ACTN|nr:hypothetical protein [Glycomyces paridis]THV26019.1 hypothetical protein E9998_20015 [Glycomyces paridis]